MDGLEERSAAASRELHPSKVGAWVGEGGARVVSREGTGGRKRGRVRRGALKLFLQRGAPHSCQRTAGSLCVWPVWKAAANLLQSPSREQKGCRDCVTLHVMRKFNRCYEAAQGEFSRIAAGQLHGVELEGCG